MRILVTGGTGFLGQHLVQALLLDGHSVRFMGRNSTSAKRLLALGAQPIIADLRDYEAVSNACHDIDAVYHVGALSAPWGKRADFHAINVRGTESIIAGCQRHSVHRLIYVSSPSVVFDGRDQLLASEAVPYPRHFTSIYSLTKKLGEDRVHAAASTGLETVILRPKAIFGPGDQALLPRLIAAARHKRLPQIGDGRNLVDLTYVGNVVHTLLLALSSDKAIGNTYIITNDEHIRLWEIIRQVLAHLGLSTHLRHVSLPTALATARLMEMGAALTGREPLLTTYSATILARTQTYDISAAKRDLGYVPLLTVDAGIERTLQALKDEL